MRGTTKVALASGVATVVVLVILAAMLSTRPPAAVSGPSMTDQAGREVPPPKKVESVVCLWPEATCILYAIGAEDLVVGVDERVTDHPVLQKVWPGLEDIPVVGTMDSANMEQLVARRPDLVIVSARSVRLAEQLAKHNLPVACFHPRGKWENYLEEISLIGQCVGRTAEAAKLRSHLEEKMAEVEAVVSPLPENRRPRVYVTFAYDALRTTPLDSVARAGGINLAEGYRDIWYTVDMEWLLARDPDVIVQHALSKFDLTKMAGGWSSLRAVKQRRIYRVFIGYCGVEPAGYILQVRQMAALFHGDEVPWAGDIEADGRAIFQQVYDRGDVFDEITREMDLTLERSAAAVSQPKER